MFILKSTEFVCCVWPSNWSAYQQGTYMYETLSTCVCSTKSSCKLFWGILHTTLHCI